MGPESTVGFFWFPVVAASGAPCTAKKHGTIVLRICTMGNSRVLNTMVPSNTCRNDVYMVILVLEEIRVEYAIAYLRNKEIPYMEWPRICDIPHMEWPHIRHTAYGVPDAKSAICDIPYYMADGPYGTYCPFSEFWRITLKIRIWMVPVCKRLGG